MKKILTILALSTIIFACTDSSDTDVVVVDTTITDSVYIDTNGTGAVFPVDTLKH